MKHNVILTIIGFFITSLSLSAQDEFLINSNLRGEQRNPVISRINTNGDYVVVWKSVDQLDSNSQGDIFMQLFDSADNKIGPETLVNDSTAGDQKFPSVASGLDGFFVVSWASFNNRNLGNSYDIKAKIFNNGNVYKNEFLVNSFQPNTQTMPAIDMHPDEKFIIAFESWYQDGSDRGIFAQQFTDLNGSKTGDNFLINTQTEYSQARPVIKYLSDGSFIAAWESYIPSSQGYDIFAKVFDKDGIIIKDEFQVNSCTEDYQWFGDIAVDTQDNFSIVWCSWEQDGYDGGIYMQNFNNSFEKVGEEILINSSTKFYQWLPKVEYIDDGKLAVLWSNWELDGSREGVFYKLVSDKGKPLSLERKINDYTDNYQWEPDFIVPNPDEILVVWSSWGQYNEDYEIIGKRVNLKYTSGFLDKSLLEHSAGNTTSDFVIHVVDSSLIVEDTYSIYFGNSSGDYLTMYVRSLSSDELKIDGFPINFGSGVSYITEEFDGISVELIPEFNLALNFKTFEFINSSGTNITFELQNPTISPAISPIDIALIWGNPDTLSDGSYSNPLDTVLSTSNKKEIIIPFTARDITDDSRIEMVIFENTNTKNLQWDAGEKIVFMTPEEYKTSSFSTHAQLISTLPDGGILLPAEGDTIFINTLKPLSVDDEFQFTVSMSNIISDVDKTSSGADNYLLEQNYPNPFNPSTTISFYIPSAQKVILTVYNTLGEEVTTIINGLMKAGSHSVEYNGSGLSSGIYLYRLSTGNVNIVRKMLFLK